MPAFHTGTGQALFSALSYRNTFEVCYNVAMKKTDPAVGLSEQEAAKREKNIIRDESKQSYKSIFLQNTFTFFNLVNFALAALVFLTGTYRNMLFMGVVISNMVIGIVQEIRAKRVLDQLALIHQEKAHVVREGRVRAIPVSEIARGDIVALRAGDQISCDGTIVSGGVECSEAMLTGESDAIEKKPDDQVLSGSFVIAGSARMEVDQVGEKTYIAGILKEAKRNKRYPSQLRDSLQKIIKVCTYSIVPLGLLLFGKQYYLYHDSWNEAILGTVAALIGMIPEGLVILTSIALAVSSMKLARRKVLVQELYCIETLARVDVLCCDKTGTLTKGKMKVVGTESFTNEDVVQILANMYTYLSDDNATAQAIRAYVDKKADRKPDSTVPFQSTIKCSKAAFGNTTYICGAYSFIFADPDKDVMKKIDQKAREGKRVLALAREEDGRLTLLALLFLQDILRKDARKILDYFQKQDVQIKIISGDDPLTVAAIAKEAGVAGRFIDMSRVHETDLEELVEQYDIFGRVAPEQKKEMVLALKKKKHTVAMTGDGVNDVMALKEADCSIAMGSGAQAARNTASLVLLKNQFEAMPSILKEGRCVINNIQRTASLFLVKTMFSFFLSALTLFFLSSYPFQPIQLTLVSALAVGLPGFVLTLEPDEKRVKGNFLRTVISRAVPGAVCVTLCVIVTKVIGFFVPMSEEQFSTICTILTGVCELCVLYKTCIPFTPVRKVLWLAMCIVFGCSVVFLKPVFYLAYLPLDLWLAALAEGIAIPYLLFLMYRQIEKRHRKDE